MRIKSLKIERFRCFGADPITVDFSKGNYFVVVGPNGAGKSNLVEAIRWATGSRSITSDNVDISDFHGCDSEKPLLSEIQLADPIQKGDTFNHLHQVHYLAISAREYSKGDQKGDIRASSLALSAERQPIMMDVPIPRAKNKQFSDEEKEAFLKPLPLTVRDLRSDLSIFFLDPTNFEYNLSTRRGSLLSALTKVMGADLFREDAKVEFKGNSRRRKDVIKELTDEIGGILQSDRADAILQSARDFMAEQMELPKDALGLSLTLPSGQDLISKLSLLARDGHDSPAIPVESCGKGYSALAMVGLFRSLTLADVKPGFVLLVEEPESFLAPAVRSAFANQLREFASAGNQVIIVTHSPEFIDPYEPGEVIRLTKADGKTQVRQWPVGTGKPTFDKALKFVEPNLGKMMFARRLLFVEGADDIAAVRAALKLKSVDPAFFGLEVIRMDGKTNCKAFHSYVSGFGIPHAFLLDADAKPNAQAMDATGKTWKLFDPDLEGVLGTVKVSGSNSSNVYGIVSAFADWPALKASHPKFAEPIEGVLTELGITP